MQTFRAELTAPAGPDEVHAYLEDFARHPEWRFDVAASTLAGGLPGGVGARYDQVLAAGHRERSVEAELMDSERPTMLAFRVHDGHGSTDVGLEIVPEGDGSRVALEVGQAWHGRPWHRRPRDLPSAEELAVRYARDLAAALGGAVDG